MKVAVIGGTGMLGTQVVHQLAESGNEVRILSRRPPESLTSRSSHHRIDLATGEGLDQALGGVSAVVDAGNEVKAAEEVLVQGTRDLLERCRDQSVEHYVGISIIGCEQLGFSYYVAKTRQEQVIQESPIGWSMVKATQFHELLDFVFQSAGRYRVSPAGRIPLQTIAASIVAARLASIATGNPSRSTELIAGPEVQDLGSMSKAWRQSTNRRCIPLRVWVPGKSGRALRAGAWTDPEAATPGPTFEEWLESRE